MSESRWRSSSESPSPTCCVSSRCSSSTSRLMWSRISRSSMRRPNTGGHGAVPAGMIGAVLDHLSLQVADLDASAAFYEAVLPTVGGERVMSYGDQIGYGVRGQPTFWIG